jgi:hypothetical protein
MKRTCKLHFSSGETTICIDYCYDREHKTADQEAQILSYPRSAYQYGRVDSQSMVQVLGI